MERRMQRCASARAGLLLAAAWLACATPASPTGVVEGAPVESGVQLKGTSGRYTVQLIGEGWRLSEGEGVDLALRKTPDAVIAMRVLAKSADLSGLIAARRQQLVDEGSTLDSSDERRSFLEGSDLVPFAFVRYATKLEDGPFTYMIALAELDDAVIEGFAYSRSSQPGLDAEVEGILRSVRIVSTRPAAEAQPR
jgi:hypothetical protein